jgi:crotonobetainyl-CoA:carnitine CoA-transferase CaiB-like acyl-CoA transferase
LAQNPELTRDGWELQVVEPLAGLAVVDLSTTPAGALATQFLADAGADVVFAEPPGGSALRARADWPAVGRGKRSIVIDLADDGDRRTLDGLLTTADVLVTTFAPRSVRRWGFTAEALERLNPRLVSAVITGWGTAGPWADLKGYEGMIMAKLGYFQLKQHMFARPGPAFVSVPFATWGAAQTALHGIMSALVERGRSGRGQQVEADLVRGINAMDTWNWYQEQVGIRWPDAFQVVEAFNKRGEIQAPLIYPLLAAPTSDGTWLQFAQTEPRLFKAMLDELGLGSVFADPKWAGLPVLPTQELRTEFWEIMLNRVSQRSMAEWQQVFDRNPNVFAEVFRQGPQVLEHPQLAHDGRVITVDDPDLGPVRQPSTLAHVDERPMRQPSPAPRLNADAEQVRARAAAAPTGTGVSGEVPPSLPLEGITILDFGLMFAGPFGATLLADLGARVIKVESLAGDTIRSIIAFPESGGAKVMQGKESIAVDLASTEGLRIVHELVRRADVVLQAFRAGAAQRAHIDPATLRAINPDLVYVSAPGYGTGGPYGHRPAYAPSIGAGAGLARTDTPTVVTAAADIEQMKDSAIRLYTATAAVPIQADGIAALAVASTILLGVLARARGRAVGDLTATMVGSATHAIVEQVIDYRAKPRTLQVDPEGYGYWALYRMYRAADGWIFLAAPAGDEWDGLVASLSEHADIAVDPRFASPAGRRENETELAETLAKVFLTRPAAEWERDLTAAGVGCVEVGMATCQKTLQTDEAAAAEYAVAAESPVFEEHLRPGPAVRFSRSPTRAQGFCSAGQHTDQILAELGYDEEQIGDFRAQAVVA